MIPWATLPIPQSAPAHADKVWAPILSGMCPHALASFALLGSRYRDPGNAIVALGVGPQEHRRRALAPATAEWGTVP